MRVFAFPCDSSFRAVLRICLLAAVLPVSGCGAMVAGGVVMGAGSAVVGVGTMATKGAVGAVRLTGRTAGAAVGMVIPENEPDAEAQ